MPVVIASNERLDRGSLGIIAHNARECSNKNALAIYRLGRGGRESA
jgi:hypothetical protein